MTISDENLQSRFSGSVELVQLASNEGLNGIATAALIIWSADAAQATLAQIERLILGNFPTSLLRKRFERGKALARYWKRCGMPEEVIRRMNQFDAAREQSLHWLAKQGVTRQDELPMLWGATRQVYRSAEDEKLHQLTVAIVNACTGNWINGDLRPGDVAAAIVGMLPVQEAEEFCLAAKEALVAKGEK